jgi:hypothetical protein
MTITARQPLDAVADLAGRLHALDAPAKPIGALARKLGPGALKDLLSGLVRRGPATAPQPAYATRTRAGHVDVRLER